MKKQFNSKFWIIALVGSLALISCEKLLDKEPDESGGIILPENAVETAEDLQQLLNSAYDVLANGYNGRIQNPANLLSDNLERPFNQNDYESVWLRQTTIFNGSVGDAFRELYIAVFRANTVLEDLPNVSGLSEEDARRTTGEAKFIRALCHFDAVRGWAHPYGFTPGNTHPGVAIRNRSSPENLPRSTVGEVYNFILQDLADAQEVLPEINDVYATKWAALALEAEVRFQMQDYEKAHELANQVIESNSVMFDTEVNKYQWPQASPEAYFYIFSAELSNGDIDNRNNFFRDNYNSLGGSPSLRVQPDLYDMLTSQGTGVPRGELYQELNQDGNISYVTTMFDEQSFNIPVLTLTQMMLIRAESAAELGLDLSQAIDDINAIRERAYASQVLNLLPSANSETVITAARNERRMEFPFNAQRYHDLKRIGAQGENPDILGYPYDCNGMILQFPAVEGTETFELNPGGGC